MRPVSKGQTPTPNHLSIKADMPDLSSFHASITMRCAKPVVQNSRDRFTLSRKFDSRYDDAWLI